MAARCFCALMRVPLSRRSATFAVRAFSQKAGDAGAAFSSESITKMFTELDASTAAAEKTVLPLKLTGRSGDIVRDLYSGVVKAGDKDGKKLEKIAKDLAALVAVIENAGLVVDRFFTTSNYSDSECKLVVDTLVSTKEPLTSFEGIKDANVKELIVDNEGNLETWVSARKAVAAVGIAPEVAGVLDTLASEGRLDLLKHVSDKVRELRSVTSRIVDADVRSAVPLTKEQQEAISKALPKYVEAGHSLSVNYTVDPAVLGGLLVTIKNQTIDLSATSRLVEVIAAQ